jgi:hypothetical protein
VTTEPPDYAAARRVYSRLKAFVDGNAAVREEVIDAIRALVTEYSTSIPENRFIVGGAVEHIIGAAMRAGGIPAHNRGHLDTGADIRVDGVALSVKACLTRKPGSIGLINTRGSSAKPAWSEPTLLVLSGVGIAYLDPLILPNATRNSSDQVQLDHRAYLPFLAKHPQYLLAMAIPPNPKSNATRVASYAVAEEILSRLNFKILKLYRTSNHP